ncbi:hypothetical protein [Xenorhabdus bovienii]|nr:hypothetical protein [Xenorhabdus bovienii]MDE9430148.1 hypothetical protein [Xenorhabdus bovienii]MDE9564620.1 hypothetical protein [Xenorhabdus bovienii]
MLVTMPDKELNRVDYPTYMQALHNILNVPAHSFDLTTRIGMVPLAFALADNLKNAMIQAWQAYFG